MGSEVSLITRQKESDKSHVTGLAVWQLDGQWWRRYAACVMDGAWARWAGLLEQHGVSSGGEVRGCVL